jgi:heme A synthase
VSATVIAFVGGLFAMGFAVIGLLFLRFWRQTRERLFAAFAVAFWLLAAGQAVTGFLGVGRENEGGAYLLRLAAFVVILGAIVAKNISRGPGS